MAALRTLSILVRPLRRNLLWCLLATYALAAWLPQWGNHLRQQNLGELPFSAGPLNPTHVLLAVLLFCVGITIRSDEARSLWRLSRSVAAGLLGSWLIPLAGLCIVLVAGACISGAAWSAFLAGAVLVVAMPPANSSSVWSELSGGQAAAAVSVIILSTLLTPIAAPGVAAMFAGLFHIPGIAAPQSTATLMEVLFAFVVLPAALGVALRGVLDAICGRWVQPLLGTGRLVSLMALLLLNYINAAAVLPGLASSRLPVDALAIAMLTAALCMAVFGVGLAVSRYVGLEDAGRRISFVYVCGMKNTGAALVLATTLLADRPLAVLVPVLYTLAQHLAASLLDRWFAAPTRAAEELPPVEFAQASTPSY